MIKQKKLPPVSLKNKIRGVIFIIAIIGLSITASHIFVPRMIAFTVMNDNLSSITPDDFITVKNKLMLLPDFLNRHCINSNDAEKSIEGLSASKIRKAAEAAFPEKEN